MTERLQNHLNRIPEGLKALLALEASIRNSGIEAALLHLVRLRASQINGCAFCIAMHVSEARRDGVEEMRMLMLPAWRESELYSARERAALAWTETLTRVAETAAPDEDYALVDAQFDEREQVQLTLAIGAINLWNRMQVGFRVKPDETLDHAAA